MSDKINGLIEDIKEECRKTQTSKDVFIVLKLREITEELSKKSEADKVLDCPKKNCGWNKNRKCDGMGGPVSEGQFCLPIARALRQYKQ